MVLVKEKWLTNFASRYIEGTERHARQHRNRVPFAMYLNKTKIFRGGTSSGVLYEEQEDIICQPRKENIEIEFRLRSKGGGRTAVKIVFQYSDLIAMIEASLHFTNMLKPEIKRLSDMLDAEDISRLKLSIEKAKEAQILIDSLEQMTDQLRSLMWEIDSDTDE